MNGIAKGEITHGISYNALSIKTIDFIYNNLASWRDDPDRPCESAENKLNLQLCKYLDVKARSDFPMVRFDHEEYQTERRSVDISASLTKTMTIGANLYTIYNPFLVLECKRLPAPSKDREKEYVTGGKDKKSGGIQRFKLGLHGKNHTIAVIIGYIQEYTAKYWLHKINEWILDFSKDKNADCCDWHGNEILKIIEKDKGKEIPIYRSSHNRIINSEPVKNIDLNHLWVLMKINVN